MYDIRRSGDKVRVTLNGPEHWLTVAQAFQLGNKLMEEDGGSFSIDGKRYRFGSQSGYVIGDALVEAARMRVV